MSRTASVFTTHKNIALASLVLFYTILTIFFSDIPFFWDGPFFSEGALYFYDRGWNDFVLPNYVNTGGFPLFQAMLALWWSIVGKTLLASHLFILLISIALAYEYLRMASRILQGKYLYVAAVFLAFSSVITTQFLLMGYDLLLLWFFLAAANRQWDNKRFWFSVWLTLLLLSNMRSLSLIPVFVLMDWYLRKSSKDRMAALYAYVLPVLLLIGWFFWHNSQAGWWLIEPGRSNNHREIIGFSMVWRQCIYVLWKVCDNGYILLWLLTGSLLLFLRKNISSYGHIRHVFWLLLITLIFTSLPMVFIGNPVGHRYFMICFVLLALLTAFRIQQIKSSRHRKIWIVIISASLLAGNFVYYPERFGNAWDSSLKVLPYFSLKEEMDTYMLDHNIPQEHTGIAFPMFFRKEITHLQSGALFYNDIDERLPEEWPYIVYSNISNSNSPAFISYLENHCKPIYTLQKAQVRMVLYERRE